MEKLEEPNPSSDEAKFDLKFIKRFWKICKILFPYVKHPSVLMAILLLLVCLLQEVLNYYIGLVTGKFYETLQDKDKAAFKAVIFETILIIVSKGLVDSVLEYVRSLIGILFRRSISTKLHDIYFTDILYYKINVVDKSIDNPDQRITQDVERMCSIFSDLLVPILITPFVGGYYLYRSYQVSGYVGPVACVGIFVVFTVTNKILMSPVSKYYYKQEEMEGNFRFKHMQIRVNAESAAFYRAGNIERKKTNKKLYELLFTQNSLIKWQLVLNCNIFLADNIGPLFPYIAIGVPIFLGSYDDYSPGQLSAVISNNTFFSSYLMETLLTLIDRAVDATDVIGCGHRIGQLIEELQRLEVEQEQDESFKDGGFTDNQFGDGNTFVNVKSVSYGFPNSSTVLCKDLNMQLKEGHNILVTGESGCGKSSLFRTLFGLWPVKSGIIEDHIGIGSKEMICLPQKAYFTNGTLRDQIMYPFEDEDVVPDDDKMYKYLDLLGLNDLLNRLGGLDVDDGWSWYDEMSPGEMQRLCFVRLFFHKPKVAVLDESTSQVSQGMEELIYKKCQELNITLLSIAHRTAVRQFHEFELAISTDGSWTLKPIQLVSHDDSNSPGINPPGTNSSRINYNNSNGNTIEV